MLQHAELWGNGRPHPPERLSYRDLLFLSRHVNKLTDWGGAVKMFFTIEAALYLRGVIWASAIRYYQRIPRPSRSLLKPLPTAPVAGVIFQEAHGVGHVLVIYCIWEGEDFFYAVWRFSYNVFHFLIIVFVKWCARLDSNQ